MSLSQEEYESWLRVRPPPKNRTTIHLAGLELTIDGLSNLPPPASPPTPITAVYLLHGRGSSIDAFNQTAEKLTHVKHPVITVLFAQRNHGHRLVSTKQNDAWNASNPAHAVDMFSIYYGTSRDVSEIIDFLPALLFPEGEYVIKHNVVMGVSLGGHSTWMTLLHEPRVEAACVVIGCADYVKLMEQRAAQSGIAGYKTGACREFPKTLLDVVERYDPAALKRVEGEEEVARRVRGKKLLVLSGAEDKLVPYAAQESFVKWLEGVEGVDVVDKVFEGVGHAYPDSIEDAFLNWLDSVLKAWY